MQLLQTLPPGFTLRPPTLADAEVVHALINAREIAHYGIAETTLDDVQRLWQEPGFNSETDAWLIVSPQGEIVGTGSVSNSEHARYYSRSDVHQDYVEQGLEAFLILKAEQYVHERINLAAPDVRITLNAWTGSANQARQQILEALGFKKVRNFWRMGIELDSPPPIAQWSDGIKVQTLVPGMERAVYAADMDAFRDHWGFMPTSFEEWAHWNLKREGVDTSLWFLAMAGDEIAAFALCQDEKEQGGWVHDLAVRRPWRRQGIGLALLHHAFGEFYRRGIKNIYLGVDAQNLTGATRLYERAGMHVTRLMHNFEKELRPGRELSTQEITN